MITIISRVLPLFFLLACAVTTKLPTNRMRTSEATGIGSVQAHLNASGAVRVSTVPNEAADPVREENNIKKSFNFLLQSSLGLSDSTDLNISVGSNVPVYVGMKWQIFGAPVASAKGGSFSSSILAGYGIGVNSGTIEASESEDNKHREYIYTSSYSDIELSLGYRIMDPLLVYAGLFYNSYKNLLEYNTGIEDRAKSRGHQNGYHIGVEYKIERIVARLNVANTKHQQSSSGKELIELYYGLSIGILF